MSNSSSSSPAQSQIVKNNSTNYSLYYNTLNYFKTIMKNHPSINHVTQGDNFGVDTKEFPMYPVGNVLLTNATFGTNITTYEVQLIVADKTQTLANESDPITNEQDIPYYGIDDVVDIHANTLSIINDLTSYTQRSLDGFEINGDISCTPFVDRFNNGLAGWSADFELTVHNDKNRCLFFLIIPDGQFFLIEDCETGERYNAVVDLEKTVTIGQVFASQYFPDTRKRWETSYDNLRCFTVLDSIEDRDNYDLWNLPILAIPYDDFVTCELCDLWITPKIWSTTPEQWGSGVDKSLRKWQYT